ncbi:MAG: phage holin family protein [Oscillospiraceae bacterium]|nr:phage holin family protein [Oscillospiraceae bacterium]
MIKHGVCITIGAIGGAIASLFGGWDTALITLVISMAIDYVTGLIVAAVFHKSNKSATGGLESSAGWKGIARKFVTLCIVVIANYADKLVGSTYIRDAVVIGFCANEFISILENAGLMGLPIPKVLTRAIDVLKQKSDDEEGHGDA